MMFKKKEFAYFKPAGPLRYMLTDRSGEPRLGIYHYSKDDQLVLIGNCYGIWMVFWPSEGGFDDIIEDRVRLSAALLQMRWTTTGITKPDLISRFVCRVWLYRELSASITHLPRLQPYVNLFYVFRQHRLKMSGFGIDSER